MSRPRNAQTTSNPPQRVPGNERTAHFPQSSSGDGDLWRYLDLARPVGGRGPSTARRRQGSSEALTAAFGPGARRGKETGGGGGRHSKGAEPIEGTACRFLFYHKRGQSPCHPEPLHGENPLHNHCIHSFRHDTDRPVLMVRPPHRDSRGVDRGESLRKPNPPARSRQQTCRPRCRPGKPTHPPVHPNLALSSPSLQVRTTPDQVTARKEISRHSVKGRGLEPRENTWPVTP